MKPFNRSICLRLIYSCLMTCNGTPKRETHVFKNANAMKVAEVSCKGVASTFLVALSMPVSTYLASDVYTPS